MILKLLQRFLRQKDGVLPVIFAIAIVPGMALVGMAIDFAGARSVKTRLQAAADAAVLEALTQSERLESEAGNEFDFFKSDTGYLPIKRGSDLFKALAETTNGATAINHTLSVERKGSTFTAKIDFSADYLTTMPNIGHASLLSMTGRAESSLTISGSGYLDIHALLDTSSSMGIGASKQDIDNLTKYLGCAFSCHGEKPKEVAVKLRIDVLRDAVLDMIEQAKQSAALTPDEPKRVRIQLNKFDHNRYKFHDLSSDYSSLKDAVEHIKLPDYHAGTNIGGAMNWITPLVPASGNGLSASTPRRFVFLVTDGLEDRYPKWQSVNFPSPFGTDWDGKTVRTGSIDPATCSTLKSKGVTVGVLYTTYIGIPDEQEHTWKKPLPVLRDRLKECASDNFFFEASNAAQLSAEFKKMFKKAVQATNARLSK